MRFNKLRSTTQSAIIPDIELTAIVTNDLIQRQDSNRSYPDVSYLKLTRVSPFSRCEAKDFNYETDGRLLLISGTNDTRCKTAVWGTMLIIASIVVFINLMAAQREYFSDSDKVTLNFIMFIGIALGLGGFYLKRHANSIPITSIFVFDRVNQTVKFPPAEFQKLFVVKFSDVILMEYDNPVNDNSPIFFLRANRVTKPYRQPTEQIILGRKTRHHRFPVFSRKKICQCNSEKYHLSYYACGSSQWAVINQFMTSTDAEFNLLPHFHVRIQWHVENKTTILDRYSNSRKDTFYIDR